MEEFDYGIIEIYHRLRIDRPINHETITLNKCIRFGIVGKTNGVESWYEIQIIYRDENFEQHCGKYRLDEYQMKILHKGNMQIEI